MKIAQSFRLAFVALSVSLVGCGPEEGLEPKTDDLATGDQEIVGGTDTTIDQTPWQVSLQSTSGSHFCGGSIIDANWILTAQHCVNNGGTISKPGRIVAGITKLSQSSSGQIRTVAEVIAYPGYVDASKGKDVALLRLSSPLTLNGTTVKAIGLVTAADATAGVTAAGVAARITGWGTTSSGGSIPDNLKTADVSIVSNQTAQTSYPQETITADQLAAAAPGKDTCQGDSGGPLTVLKSGVRTLAGVTSWGYGCADSRYPGMYARVSEFQSWIAGNVGGGGTTPPPPSGTVTTETRTGSVAQGEMKQIGSFSVVAGTQFKVVMTGSGDPDLYVRFGSAPTTSSHNCRPYKSGASETCDLVVPSGTSLAYVAVRGYTAGSYNLTITYTKSGGTTTPPPPSGTVTSATYTGSVTKGQFKQVSSHSVVAGTSFKVTMTGSGDPDLYVRFGSAPTLSAYTCRPYTSGASETCTLTVPAGTTTAYVAVNGYSAGSYSIKVDWTKP